MITPEQMEREAPVGWFSAFDAEILISAVVAIPGRGIYLEIGVHKGRSLWTARQATKDSVEIWGVDLAEDPEIEGTNFIRGDSRKVPFEAEIDVLFVDGDHSYEGCKADIEHWYPKMKNDGVMLFHDCDETSPGVVQAVKEFVQIYKPKEFFVSPNQRCSMARVRL